MQNILFICALEEEKSALITCFKKSVTTVEVAPKLSITLDHLIVNNFNVYVAQSGMGNVNAAVSLALILTQIPMDQTILIGVGGALEPSLNIGDMVLSDRVVQHDYFSSLDEGNFHMYPGALITEAAQAKSHDPIIHSCPGIIPFKNLQHDTFSVYHGLIASGSEFVGTSQRKQSIHQQHGALLVDMEASAIAAVSNQFDCPFIIAKTVSDKLNSDGSIATDFSNFLSNAARNAAIVGLSLLYNK